MFTPSTNINLTYHSSSGDFSSCWFWGRLLFPFGKQSLCVSAAADDGNEEDDKDRTSPSMVCQLFLNLQNAWKESKHCCTHKHDFLFIKALGRIRMKVNNAVSRAKEEVAQTKRHMMQKTGSDTDKCFCWMIRWWIPLWWITMFCTFHSAAVQYSVDVLLTSLEESGHPHCVYVYSIYYVM